jgi:hypothetical protein
MAWKRKHVILTSAWVLSLAISNHIGGVVGFGQGEVTRLVLSASLDAVSTVRVLRMLRGGRSQEVIQLLETHLDAQIAAAVSAKHSYYSPYNPLMRFTFGDTPVKEHAYDLAEVLKYREEYPDASGYASVDELMKKLEVYRNAPRP